MISDNQQDKLADLARLLGWTQIHGTTANKLAGIPPGYDPKSWATLPNYYTDLNAAHDLGEEMARRGLRAEWVDALRLLVVKHPSQVGTPFIYAQATAAQRAEAARLTLLKAQEGEEK
jgi:hypothetical protein